jgi:hypothetical protein
MSLFLNIDDLRGCLPVNVSFELGDLEPFFLEVENTILCRHITSALYANLYATLHAPNAEVDEELLVRCRRAVAPLALSNYLPFGQVHISTVGITTVSKSSERTAAYSYQVDDLNQSALNMGFNALESLVDYLEERADDYELYANSPEHVENTRLLVPSAREFSSIYPIFNSRLTYYALRPTLASLQDETLIETIGTELFNKLKANTGLTDDEKKLRDRAKKWLAFRTIVEVLGLQLSVELNSGGVRVNYGSMFSNTYKYYTPPTDAQRSIATETATKRAAGLWSEIGSLLDTINGVDRTQTPRAIISDKATVLF